MEMRAVTQVPNMRNVNSMRAMGAHLERHPFAIALLFANLVEAVALVAIIANEPGAIGFKTVLRSFQLEWFAWYCLIAAVLNIASLAMVAAVLTSTVQFAKDKVFRGLFATLAVWQILLALLALLVEREFTRDFMRLDPFAAFFVLAMMTAALRAAFFIRGK